MTNFVGLVTFLLALMASSCISGQECPRPRDVIKNSECSTCKKLSIPTDTCFEADHCHWCCECPPGTYVAKNCISLNNREPTSTICEPCDPGFYTSTNNNATSCTKSKSEDFCKRLQYTKFVQGSLEKDGRCECVTGTYSPDPETGGCKKHSPCAKGFGLKIPGNETHDVQCEYCPEGMCSDQESSTQKCQRCDDQSSNKTSILTTPSPMLTTNVIPSDMSTADTPSSEPISDNRGWMPGVMFGAGFLGGVIVFLLIFGCRWRKRRQRKKKKMDGDHGDLPMQPLARSSNLEGHGDREMGEDSDNNSAPDEGMHRDDSKKPLIRQDDSRQIENEKVPQKESLLKTEPLEEDENLVNLQLEKKGHDPPPISKEDEEKGPVKEISVGAEMEDPPLEVHEDPEAPVEATSFPTKDPDPKSKTGNLSEDEYTKIFFDKGCDVSYYPDPNGSCQFSAIVHQLHPDLSREEKNQKANELRQKVVKYMRTHPEHFDGFSVGNLNTYVTRMSKTTEYGDHPTLQAASNILQKTFKVIQTSNQGNYHIIAPRGLEQQPQSAQDIILLGHVGEDHGSHYVCLSPRMSDEDPPPVQTPMSDMRVEEGSHFRFDKSPPPPHVGSQGSPNTNGFYSPRGNFPAPQPAQPAPSSPAVPNENGLPDAQQRNNEPNGIDQYFVNDQDKYYLAQIPPDVLQSALNSKDFLHQMLLGLHGLHRNTSTQDLKDLIRQHCLIGNETDIQDIEYENAQNHKEMRTKLLQKAEQEQGKRLTPRKILKLTVDHKPRKIYDDLCIAFIKYMEQKVNAGDGES